MNHNSPFETKKGKILYLTNQGLGRLIDDNGKEVDLPFCLGGETVVYDDVKRRRHTDYYFKEVINPSLDRAIPICPHFTKCGGCLLQHLKPQEYKDFKKSVVTSLFIEEGLDPFVIEDLIIIEQGNRRRTNIEAIKKNDSLFFGFHQIKSHRIIDIDVCPVLHPEIEKLIKPLKVLLHEVLENFQKAKLFITHTHVGVDLSLEVQELTALNDHQKNLITQFAQENNLCRCLFKYRKNITILHQSADPYVLIDNVEVKVDPWCFLQASLKADEILTSWIIQHLPSDPNKIIDLFCGRGTFTLPLSKYGITEGFECDKNALDALRSSINNRSITAHYRNLFEEPLSVTELNQADAVVLDPPRAGAVAQCEILAQSKVEKIIYVSCNPHTFVKDTKQLQKGGYQLEKVYLLDQFIYTAHLECVGIFSKL